MLLCSLIFSSLTSYAGWVCKRLLKEALERKQQKTKPPNTPKDDQLFESSELDNSV